MAASFEVVLADLQSMAGTFHTEADGYRAMVPGITPTAVDAGDSGLNSVMASVFTSIATLHELMATAPLHSAACSTVCNRGRSRSRGVRSSGFSARWSVPDRRGPGRHWVAAPMARL